MTCFIDTKHPLYIAARIQQLTAIWMERTPPIVGLPEGTAAWNERNRLVKLYRKDNEDADATVLRLINLGIEQVDAAVPPPADPTIPAMPECGGGDQ